MISYDLHIHSCLSPCSDDDMTPNNIINMAIIKGLDLIAISDHNTLSESIIAARVAKNKIKYLYGVEIESIEAVHLLAYFKDETRLAEVEKWLEEIRSKEKNRSEYFGKQDVLDENDEYLKTIDDLLIMSTSASIDDIAKMVHGFGGIIVIAHALDRHNSIITQLGFIPKNFDFDAIEVKDESQKLALIKSHPHLKDAMFIYNSDAHRLVDINEAINQIDEEVLKKLWR